MQILYGYFRYTGRLLNKFSLLLAVILSEPHEKPRRKYWVTEKSTWKSLCKENHFFNCTRSFLCLFFWSFFLNLNWLFTTKIPEIPGTHFIELGRMKGWVGFGASQKHGKNSLKNTGPLDCECSVLTTRPLLFCSLPFV